MLAPVPRRHRARAWLRVVHLLLDVLARPRRGDARGDLGLRDVVGAFAHARGRVEDDVVMVIVEHHGDVELFTNREEVVHGPDDVVVFEDQAAFDRVRQGLVVLAEAVEGRGLATMFGEHAAHVQDHDSVAVLLRWEFEESKELVVVFEVAEGVFDYLTPR